MEMGESLAKVGALSDEELLTGLHGALGSSRHLLALVVAQLAEVEARRLHLLAGHGSMFAYCTSRLKMSEDEACRRIEVARLTRRFPLLLQLLASGQVSLSVAALLKSHLTEANHVRLLTSVSDLTVARAREVLAAFFPRPDVPASIRKLPARRGARAASSVSRNAARTVEAARLAPDVVRTAEVVFPVTNAGVNASGIVGSVPQDTLSIGEVAPLVSHAASMGDVARSVSSDVTVSEVTPASDGVLVSRVVFPISNGSPSAMPPGMHGGDSKQARNVQFAGALPFARQPRVAPPIEPLSPTRHKIQFTGDVELKRKLELARDLLRHAVPNGDLAIIVSRALDLLIEKAMQRRFGTRRRDASAAERVPQCVPQCVLEPEPVALFMDRESAHAAVAREAPVVADATPGAPHDEPGDGAERHSRHIPASVRRQVLDRDGARCTWRGPDGTRCDSQAWLEHDHITPRGQGGSNEPANLRIRCRAHNRLAAEQAYGQEAIARSIEHRRASRPPDARARSRQPPPDPG